MAPVALSSGTSPVDPCPPPSIDSISQTSGEDLGKCAMDVNMPEILAQDLEISKQVFHSRLMTAGAPSPNIPTDRPERFVGSPSQYSYYGMLLDKFNTLGSIAEQESGAETSDEDAAPGLMHIDNFSDTDESDGGSDPADCIRDRKQSVVTAATSVSGPLGSPEFSRTPPSNQGIYYSWYSDEDDDCKMTVHVKDPVNELKPWSRAQVLTFRSEDAVKRVSAPTSPISGISELDSGPPTSPPKTATVIERPRLVHVLASSSGHMAIPVRTSSARAKKPLSPSSGGGTLYGNEAVDTDVGIMLPSCRAVPNGAPMSAPSGRTVIDASWPTRPLTPEHRLRHIRASISPSYSSPNCSHAAREQVPGDDAGFIVDHQESQTKMLASVAATIHNWLDQGVDAYAPHTAVPSTIPIAPEIFENLRIHVQNFPDTMLTCKSLAFETIRSYSHKVKHLGPSMRGADHSDFALGGSAEIPKRAFHKAVRFISSRVPGFGKLRANRPSTASSTNPVPSSVALVADWAPLKNIFPLGSDYMCEVLYAHLVAYNYVKLLYPPMFPVSGNPRPPTATGRPLPGTAGGQDDGTRISRKAATLLGISDAAGVDHDLAHVSHGRRPSVASGFSQGSSFSPAPGRTVTTRETVDELRSGLVKCIGCLVTSVSLTGGVEPKAPQFTQELLRSLAEIVRSSEERVA